MTLPITAWATNRSRRLEKRSAMAPPNGLRKNIARPCPKATKPTAWLLPVMSKATTPCAVEAMLNAMNAKKLPSQTTR